MRDIWEICTVWKIKELLKILDGWGLPFGIAHLQFACNNV